MTFFDATVSDPPQSWPKTLDNLMIWYAKPEARDPQPLYDIYSHELHDVVFEAFTPDPRGRIDSLSLFGKVLDVFKTRILPYPEHVIVPLLPKDYEGKMFDENGCTMNTGDFIKLKVLEAEMAEAMELAGGAETESGYFTAPEDVDSGSSGYYTAPEDQTPRFVLPDEAPKFVVPIDWSENDLMCE